MKTMLAFFVVIFMASTAIGQPVYPHTEKSPRSRGLIFNPEKHTPNPDQIRHKRAINPGIPINPFKSPNSVKQRLDSMLIEVQPFGKAPLAENYQKTLFYYNADAMDSAAISYQWEQDLQTWTPEVKTRYQYNPDGTLGETYKMQWYETTGQWEEGLKYVYSYDGNGWLSSVIEYYGNGSPISWAPSYKYEYTRDLAGNLLLDLQSGYDPDSAAWHQVYKNEYTYNLNGKLESQTESPWMGIFNQWVPGYKYVHSYSLTGKKILTEELSWDADSVNWVWHYKNEFEYDTNGYLSKSFRSYWNENYAQWDLNYKSEYQSDLAGNQLMQTDYYWDTFVSAWVYGAKTEQSYNMNYAFYDLILPRNFADYGSFSPNMLTDIKISNHYSGSWHDTYQYRFFYNQASTTGIEDIAASSVHVYPNPATSAVFVEWEGPTPNQQIEFFDLAGKPVFQTLAARQAMIDVRNFARGIYFYRLTDNQRNVTCGKISIL